MEKKNIDWSNITFYIPYHSNYSQLEGLAPLIAKSKTKIFLYTWNTSYQQMEKEFAGWKTVSCHPFTQSNMLSELSKDFHAHNPVVFLLTASLKYSFGRLQSHFLHFIKSNFFPNIIDVFILGHCMFGCDSCGIREHNVPLFFTRFFNKTLPFSTRSMTEKYFPRASIQDDTSKRIYKVLICPSVGPKSFLQNIDLITNVLKAAKEYPVEILFKLHNSCYLSNDHPHSNASEEERKSVEFLLSDTNKDYYNYRVVAEEEYVILPFLEISDLIITDLDSSVAFESLYFSSTSQVAAFDWRDEEATNNTTTEMREYMTHLHLFKTFEQIHDVIKNFTNTGSSSATSSTSSDDSSNVK
eukprot:TRINITY_DN2336_c0_g1_i1.p1 TRINITY_DN2336_c0_g1~~TRINITY_DN2336_c0_g1_i1.p1  ORF type:complete len:364 (-),score=87.22 TRINITY_DN2336_c0_g1_i1:673-1737(-)